MMPNKQLFVFVLAILYNAVIVSATACQFPGNLQHGSHKVHRRYNTNHQRHIYRAGDTITYTCNHGYHFDTFDEFQELVCQSDGSWDGDEDFEYFICEELQCSIPDPPTNGQIVGTPKRVYKVGEEVQFSCAPGFILSGPEVLTCSQKALDWDGFTPECYRPTCPSPRHPDHGRKYGRPTRGHNFYKGDSVRFVCNSGFKLVGSAERTCKYNGQWSGVVPTCERGETHCEDPGVPDGGYKKGQNYFQGSIVIFSCKRGFSLLGSAVRTCLSNGFWSGVEAKCESKFTFDDSTEVSPELNKEVDRLAMLTTSSVAHQRRRKRNLQALESSKGGLDLYFVFDGSGSISQGSFDKGKKLAEALVQKLGVSDENTVGGTRVGALVYSDKAKVVFHASDPLNTQEEVIEEIRGIKHIDKSTFSSKALNEVRTNMIPLARRQMPQRHNSKIAILVITDGKHNVGGDPAEEAKKLQLRKADGGYEAEIFCVGVTPESDLKSNLAKMASEPLSTHVFRLDIYERMEFLADELIQNQPEYGECGIAGENTNLNVVEKIIGGQNAEPNAWPWMAELFFAIGGNCEPDISTMVDQFKHGCGGSLIHPEWILTAAHCISHKKEGIDRYPQNLYVKLGSDRQSAYASESEQHHLVDTIYIHPEYHDPESQTTETFTNDIALLHLQQPAHLDSSVRTVCLPGDVQAAENSTRLYKHGKFGIATGWGKTKQSDSSEHLKQTQLRVQSKRTCVSTVKERHITNYDNSTALCAGSPRLDADDICRGDSGGPLAHRQTTNLRAVRFVQTGITSWNFGCAKADVYSFFTRVDKFVHWIKKVQKQHATEKAEGGRTGCGYEG